jgi:carboxypeptidase C (cathepsin A)
MIATMFRRCLLLALVFATLSLFAEPPTTEPAHHEHEHAQTKPSAHSEESDFDRVSTSKDVVTVNGQPLHYSVTAGYLTMRDESGKPRANMFYVAYRKDSPDIDLAKRPITFLFNGGPGAAAVWLHLGAVGPRKVQLDERGIPLGPPHALIENPSTWLDVSDLVFIDPVNTGYSRAVEGVKPEEFFGLQNDVHSVGEFIRVYITRNHRWPSPKFLAGESYGTTRAAALSDFLLDHGIDLNGIVFISSVLDFATLSESQSNDLPFIVYLPSYASVAFHFKKLNPDLMQDRAKTLHAAEEFALTDYPAALAKGDSLQGEARQAVIQKLADFTSLPPDLIDRNRLRIDLSTFRKRLLYNERKVIGRFDGRIVVDDPNPASEDPEIDPSLSDYFATYMADICTYLSDKLKFESDLTYEVLNAGRVQPWSFGGEGHQGYMDVSRSLASAMNQNPRMKVMFASGYQDLATPYFATDYTISHMQLPASLRPNITRKMYEGGHMLYHVQASLEQLKSDVAAFMTAALPATPNH